MPASPAARARLTAGAFAVVSALALGAVSLQDAGTWRPIALGLAAIALVVTIAGVGLGLPACGPVAAGLLGAAFLSSSSGRGAALDARTPFVAAALLLLAELIAWSAEARTQAILVPGAPVPRLAVLTVAAGTSLVAATLLAALVTIPVGRDLALTASGATAVALLTAMLVGLAQRRSART